MKTGLTTKATAEELKAFFTTNKGRLRAWDHWTTARSYGEVYYHSAPQIYTCEETGQDFTIGGIGKQKVKVNGYWYAYSTLEKALKRGYKKNSTTLNSFLITFIDDYEYKKYTDEDIKEVIRNRKNPQYLTKSEIPKYIPRGKVSRLCNLMELPILSKQLN